MTPRRCLTLLALACVACGERAPEVLESANGVTRLRHGDTTIVRTERDGVWGPARDAVELRRISGGTPETTFGSVNLLAATPDGGVVLYDSKAAEGVAIRQFDADGKFVRTLGRKGRGPGEYGQSGGMLMIAVNPNGTIYIRDGMRAVLRYGADGKFLGEFTLNGGRGSMPDLTPASDGSVYIRGSFPRGQMEPTQLPAMLHYDSAGHLLDSIADPPRWIRNESVITTYTPQQAWSTLPDKRIYYARSDKLGFLVADPAGGAPPLIGEIKADSVPYLADERAELQAMADFQSGNAVEGMPRSPTTVPTHKLVMGGAITDIDGRIWLVRRTTSQKVEPRLGAITNNKKFMITYAEPRSLVAFQTDGTFLGEVRFPMGVFIPTFVGNTAWAVLPDTDGVSVLVKFRIHD